MPRYGRHPNLRQRGRVWYVYWWEGGRQRERAVARSQAIAREFLHRLRVRLDRQRAGLGSNDVALSELWAYHEALMRERVRARDLAPATAVRVREAWAAFTSWLVERYPSVTRVRHLSLPLAREYQLARAAAPPARGRPKGGTLTARSVNTELLLVGGVFKLAAKDGRIERSPLEGLAPLKELDSIPPIKLSPDQIRALVGACDDQVRPYVLGALYTGARRGELLAVRPEDVDLGGGVVWFQNIKTRRTAKDRVAAIPIHPELESVLRARAHLPGGPWSDLPEETLRRHFKAAVRAAGLPRRTRFHDLRHALGNEMIALGEPLETIQAALRHRDRRTTADYARLRLEPLRRALERVRF